VLEADEIDVVEIPDAGYKFDSGNSRTYVTWLWWFAAVAVFAVVIGLIVTK
jgi:hypothetical protein